MKKIITLIVFASSMAAATPEKTATAQKPGPTNITVTAGQLLDLARGEAWGKLLKYEVPVGGAEYWRLHRIREIVQPEIDRVAKAWLALFTDENSIVDASGQRQIKPDKATDLQKRYDSLRAERVELPVTPLDLDPESTPGLKLNMADVDNLGPLVHVKEPTATKQ